MEAWNHKDADDALRTMEKLAMPIVNMAILLLDPSSRQAKTTA
jgi:hypothetical protein